MVAVASYLVALALARTSLPPSVACALSISTLIALLLRLGPTWKDWSLTGHHRLRATAARVVAGTNASRQPT